MLSQWSRPTLREPPSPPISPPPSPPSPPPSPPSPPSSPRGDSSPPRGDSSPPTADASSSSAYLTSPRVHARVPDFWAGAKPLPSRRPPAPCRAPPLALRAHPAGVTRALNTAPNRALETALETRATGGSGCDRWGREHFRQPAPPLIPQPTPPEFPQLASPIGTNGLFGRKQFDEGGNQPDEGGNRATANSPIGTNGLFGRKQFEKMVWGLGEPHDHEPRDRTDTANTPVRSRRDLGAISAQPLYAKTEPERRRAHLDQKRKELVESRMHSQAPPWAPPHGPRQSAHAPPWAPTTPTLHRWALHRWDPVGELPV